MLLGFWAYLTLLLFPPLALFAEQSDAHYARLRQRMVAKDLKGHGIMDPRVLEAMATVPRHFFVPERDRFLAYGDRPLPIGEGQTISQPYIIALMSQLLELKGKERVLEVGTGSGYQAAVLSGLVEEVYTVEIIPTLANSARDILLRLGYTNVHVKTGDGFFGWQEQGPFDAIIVTASVAKIPNSLWNQLHEGGRIVLPMGKTYTTQQLVRARKVQGQVKLETITDVRFVPMTGEAMEPVP